MSYCVFSENRFEQLKINIKPNHVILYTELKMHVNVIHQFLNRFCV